MGHPLYFAFDLLHLDDYDLRRAKLLDRKALLAKLLDGEHPAQRRAIRLLTHLHGQGRRVQEKACELGVEGIVSKRVDSQYQSGKRSRDWVKVRCLNVADFVIVGFTDPQHTRSGLGALLLAERTDEGELRYAGKMGTGFDDLTLVELREQLETLEQPEPTSQLKTLPSTRRGVHWVRSQLHAQVAFAERTAANQLRHATFRGLVEQREADRMPGRVDQHKPHSGKARVQVAGVTLSNPDKLFYPQQGLTKRDLATYYEAVAP